MIRPKYQMAHRSDGSFTCAHIIIAERALGHALPPGADVHHVDGDGWNNANRNLVVCQDRKYHWLLHLRASALRDGRDPNANERRCSRCREWKEIPQFHLRRTGLRIGEPMGYCKHCARDRQSAYRPRTYIRANSKLTELQAHFIKRRLAAETNTALAREFGVTQALISHIRCGHIWRDINPNCWIGVTSRF